MASNTLIEFVGIGKDFPGVKALEDIRFGIKKGEVHAIVGENGAGKSTLMNILAGIYQPDSGHLKIRGKITRIKNYAHALSLRISAVYQEGSRVSVILWLPLSMLDSKDRIFRQRCVQP